MRLRFVLSHLIVVALHCLNDYSVAHATRGEHESRLNAIQSSSSYRLEGTHS